MFQSMAILIATLIQVRSHFSIKSEYKVELQTE